MAIFKIFPYKDTTIYSHYPLMNTGLDPIIDCSVMSSGESSNNPGVSRILIEFSQEEINDIIQNKISGSNWESNLKLYIGEINGANNDTIVDIFPLYDSWEMGIGKYTTSYTSYGATWLYSNYSGSTKWNSSYNANITGSFLSGSEGGGGSWYTNISASQKIYYYNNNDLNVNITDVVKAWYSESISNNGLIIKQRKEFSTDSFYNTKIQYFSVDTNSIYPPYLEFRWNDYYYNTSSNIPNIPENQEITVNIENNITYYEPETTYKFRIFSRPKYPVKNYQTSSVYNNNYYLPTSSLYAIKDLNTNEYIVDFDPTYTRISADNKGNFFKVYMNGLQSERWYKILIKTNIDGSDLIIDNNNIFKITKG